MKLTLVISYYKAISNLSLILSALNKQSNKNFEVIVSEDDSNQKTTEYIENNKHLYHFRIMHLSQEEDNGFRKNMMLNKSIRNSKTEMLVFIDGDCIPHKHLVKEYIKHLKRGYIFFGRRVFLSETFSKKIKNKRNEPNFGFFSLLYSGSKKLKEAIYNPSFSLTHPNKNKGLVGCNWGIMKQDLIDVNGFDEDYVMPGTGEDTDVEWRLRANGLKMKSMKNKAIVYHLFHTTTRSVEINKINHKLLADKMKAGNVVCINGLKSRV